MYVDKQKILVARSADLHGYLTAFHGRLFRHAGASIYMKKNPSLYIKAGYYGYRDFSTGETGNGIDFLTRHLGYSFQEAVTALYEGEPCRDSHTSQRQLEKRENSFSLPEAAPFPHSRMYAYLLSRAIPKDVVDRVAKEGLAYQSSAAGNIVFVNRERDYCELRGTYTFAARPFHGCLKRSPDRFWYVMPQNGKPETAYITEAAIDAISLMVLHREKNHGKNSVYISIGGVSNNAAINRIKKRMHAILAVDNDRAGDECRRKHGDLEHILPTHKDWNEDLKALKYSVS